MKKNLYFLYNLGIELIKSSLFGIFFFLSFAFGKYVTSFGLMLGDFMFISVVFIQIILITTQYESWKECKIILIYHILGFIMEAFKTHPAIGSWHYQYMGFFTLLSVPLYSGFMYSAIGSFLFQAMHRLKLQFEYFPKFIIAIPIVSLIYINFFTHHFIYDIRYFLIFLIVIVTYKTYTYFTIEGIQYRMHTLLNLLLAACCIWVAENMATFLGVWLYPNQEGSWSPVSIHKLLSRFLLFILSAVIVSYFMRDTIHYKKI
ncbi:hypothetical protein XF24_00822 [candidate division SR1 bacterium Aalborg_AAW-1]|nr:hypothetical protein XF24_00822 [candidate division SR1 bacterium Aalborg_AAW-1]